MTTLHWTFDSGKEIPIECRPYSPARLSPAPAAPCALNWRMVGRLLAGALWAGCAVGVLVAIIAGHVPGGV